MKENAELNVHIKNVIEHLHPQPAEISFAVINLKTSEPELSGYNMEHFMYPASIYKVFVAAEVLRQVSVGVKKLEDLVEIKSPNDVDKNYRLFPVTTKKDNRPLLIEGDKVTIDYLLNLIFTRSDNTAANTLIDLVERESVNDHIIFPNGWDGCEITRKFLTREKEREEKYRISNITLSSAKHLVDLCYKIETKQFINEWVSEKLKEYMSMWDRRGRTGLYIPEFTNYYRKGGWLQINGYKIDFWKAIKNAYTKGHAINRWANDIGVVETNNKHYAIALLTLTKTKWPWVHFNMKKFAREIHKLM